MRAVMTGQFWEGEVVQLGFGERLGAELTLVIWAAVMCSATGPKWRRSLREVNVYQVAAETYGMVKV